MKNNLNWKEIEHSNGVTPDIYQAIYNTSGDIYTYILHCYPKSNPFYGGKTNVMLQKTNGGATSLKDLGKMNSLEDAKKLCEDHALGFVLHAR